MIVQIMIDALLKSKKISETDDGWQILHWP